MHSTKYTIAGLAIAAAMMPMAAFAQTANVSSQIQSLLSQIKALQQQLMTLIASSHTSDANGTASTTPSGEAGGQGGNNRCVPLTRNLHIGAQGDDVKSLQEMLGQDPEDGFIGTATGFFGPLTARAMMNFQMHNGIASSTDGSVGPLTRGFFERECGKGGGQGGMMEASHVSGTITAANGSSLTIQNNDGKSIVVNITASTSIQVFAGTSTPPTAGSVSDLVVGKTASADGPQNPDGSIQAVHVSVGFIPPPLPIQGGQGEGPHGMMPTINGPQGGEGDGHGGPQNY